MKKNSTKVRFSFLLNIYFLCSAPTTISIIKAPKRTEIIKIVIGERSLKKSDIIAVVLVTKLEGKEIIVSINLW
jgi:hypothetical protein